MQDLTLSMISAMQKELSAPNAMDYNAELPKTILYCLNAKIMRCLDMAGNFQDGFPAKEKYSLVFAGGS